MSQSKPCRINVYNINEESVNEDRARRPEAVMALVLFNPARRSSPLDKDSVEIRGTFFPH